MLDLELCLKEIPRNLKTWVQPTVSQKFDNSDQWWIRVYQKSGRSSPPERTVLSFWCKDQDFAEFLRIFDQKVKRLAGKGLRVAVNPDISINWNADKLTASSILKSQLMYGKRMQELEMMVLPNAPLLHPTYAESLYDRFLPKQIPLAVQIQNATLPMYGVRDYDGLRLTRTCLETLVNTTNTPQLLVYGARSVFKVISEGFSKPDIFKFVSSFSDILNGKSVEV